MWHLTPDNAYDTLNVLKVFKSLEQAVLCPVIQDRLRFRWANAGKRVEIGQCPVVDTDSCMDVRRG